MEPKFLAVGKVARLFGIRGQVEVIPLTDFPSRFSPGLKVFLSPPLAQTRSLTVESARLKKERIVIKFEEISTRSQADELKQKILQVPAKDTPSLPKDTYWHHQIIGLKVITVEGKLLGKVSDIYQTGGNDVYVVSKGENQILIPATKGVVKQVDLKREKMVVKPPLGLID